MRSREQGVALITAMLIVAIIATLATSLALGQQVWLRQTQNLADLAQAEQVRQGACEYAAAVLAADAKSSLTNKSDHLKEVWAQPISLPVEGGVVFIKIDDAQARFNLNNLLPQVQPPGPPPDQRVVFQKILANAGLSPDLANPLIDWTDGDSNITQPGGAEDLDYLSADTRFPYRAANQPLHSVEELRLVKGYSAEVVDALAPYVVVLPAIPNASTNIRKINVNTATKEVLDAATGADSTAAIEARERAPFEKLSDFESLFPPPRQFNAGLFDVKSDFFIVTVIARIGRIERRTEALIERSTGSNVSAKVLWYRQPSIRRIQFAFDEDKS